MPVFAGNSAREGGAIAISVGSLLLRDSVVIRHNSATSSGGGVYVLSAQSIQMSDNVVIWANSASIGGGLYLNLTTALNTSCCVRFVENSAINNGGALAMTSASASFGRTAFVRNSAGGGYVR